MPAANFWGVSGLRGGDTPLETRDAKVDTLIGDKYASITKNTDSPVVAPQSYAPNQVPTEPIGKINGFFSQYGMYIAGAAVLGVGFFFLRRR